MGWRIPRPRELLLSTGGSHIHLRGGGFSGHEEVLELRPLA
jgi:hypothetical protein